MDDFRVRMPIENRHGSIIGEMTIEKDGSFSGRFDPSSSIKDVLVSLAKDGVVNAVVLTPKLIPAEQADR